jgi:hypothetical protein
MHEGEVDLLEGRVRRSLGTLDQIPVPGLAAITTRRAPVRSRVTRTAGAFGATAAVLVLALVVGAQLNTWRAALSGATAGPGLPGAAAQVTPDDRYGLLVGWPGDATTLVDEQGNQLVAPFFGVREARTSPDGRYIGLWLSTINGYEVRILDGVNRTLGPTLFATTEQYARSNEGLVWASDSSAVVIATTADPVANSAGAIRVNLRAIDRGGTVASIATYSAFALQPLGWDRAKNTILARATSDSSGPSKYLRFVGGGSPSVVERTVTDMPLIANDAATYVASYASCPPPGPCRIFTIHDAETYAVVAQIDLAASSPLTRPNANWAILFRPRSSDVIVYFSRSVNPTRSTFGIELYPNAGRGGRRDLGDVSVDPVNGTHYQPNAFIRADGSAAFYLHLNDVALGEQIGDLIALPGGAHTPVRVFGSPRATVLIDPKL